MKFWTAGHQLGIVDFRALHSRNNICHFARSLAAVMSNLQQHQRGLLPLHDSLNKLGFAFWNCDGKVAMSSTANLAEFSVNPDYWDMNWKCNNTHPKRWLHLCKQLHNYQLEVTRRRPGLSNLVFIRRILGIFQASSMGLAATAIQPFNLQELHHDETAFSKSSTQHRIFSRHRIYSRRWREVGTLSDSDSGKGICWQDHPSSESL